MASIEQLLGHTTEDLEKLSTEELLEKFKEVFNLEKKLIDEAALKVLPDAKAEEDGEEDSGGEDVEAEAKLVTAKGTRRRSAATPKTAAEKAKDKMDAIKAELMELAKMDAEIRKDIAKL